ncbi:sulfite exporter TauE/SafE family protein [Thiolapillus sp.]
MDPTLIFAGFAVGGVIGLCGVGGGALMTPFLIHYGINPAIAIGTDLVYALFSKSIGAWLHHIKGTVNWGIVGRLALGSIPASLACVAMLGALNEHDIDYQWLIRDIVGITLVITAAAMLLPLRKGRKKKPPATEPGHTGYLTVLMGAVLGFLVTLSSIGSGAIGAAVLIVLYPFLPAISVVGTDLMHAVPLVGVAALGHWQLGNVDFPLLGSLVLGAAPGVWLGAKLGTRLPERYVRRILATALLLIGVQMVIA